MQETPKCGGRANSWKAGANKDAGQKAASVCPLSRHPRRESVREGREPQSFPKPGVPGGLI